MNNDSLENVSSIMWGLPGNRIPFDMRFGGGSGRQDTGDDKSPSED